MNREEKKELDISASFTVEDGVNSETLIATVKELVGEEDFQKKLVRANDDGVWFEIGNRSKHPTKQCIVLGNGDHIKEGQIYKEVTVKFKPGSKSGMEYTLGHGDFALSVLKEIRKFRDQLKQQLS